MGRRTPKWKEITHGSHLVVLLLFLGVGVVVEVVVVVVVELLEHDESNMKTRPMITTRLRAFWWMIPHSVVLLFPKLSLPASRQLRLA